ncbi:MAG TPA: type II toxin-antitoxin system prevent-host-death family antitoxin [Thermodesulfobacteriota bacterium]|nr:type II toxin-antitoxin system prevent-host-death family antitoxin [Thermodesulfobacteriota bacterium]
MAKHISAMELRKRLGEIINEVSLRDDEYIVERDGKPLVAVIPIWKLKQLEEKKEAFWKKVEEFRKEGKKVKRKELESAVAEAVEAAKCK